jgi:hypothetical protein
VTWQIAPGWYSKWVIPEGYGILEFSQFVTMMAALFIAVRLLFKPFVRKRPFVFAVTIITLELPLHCRRGDELGAAFSIGTRPSTGPWSTARKKPTCTTLTPCSRSGRGRSSRLAS